MGSMSAQDIYDNFTHAEGTDMWAAGQQAARTLAQDMREMAADIWRLRDTMWSAWQGDAADGAGTGAEPLAMEFLQSADYLHSSQDLLSRQTGSFHTAANSVRPVPAAPSVVDVVGSVAFGVPSMQNQVRDYLATSQHNVDVFSSYHGASQFNTTNLPATYGRIAMDTADVVVAPPPAAPSTTSATSPGRASAQHAPTGMSSPSSRGITEPQVTNGTRRVASAPAAAGAAHPRTAASAGAHAQGNAGTTGPVGRTRL
jgi:hypothetical protein